MKECGSCGLCCKLLEATTLDKPAGVWCQHWKQNEGCTVYSVRPDVCRQFFCLWAQGMLPDRLSPRRTGVVAWIGAKSGLILHQDRHAHALIDFKAEIAEWRRRGLDVNVIDPPKREEELVEIAV